MAIKFDNERARSSAYFKYLEYSNVRQTEWLIRQLQMEGKGGELIG